MMSLYGDMDISKITEKPDNRKKIITISKPESKVDELWPYLKKQLIEKKSDILGLSSYRRVQIFRLGVWIKKNMI